MYFACGRSVAQASETGATAAEAARWERGGVDLRLASRTDRAERGRGRGSGDDVQRIWAAIEGVKVLDFCLEVVDTGPGLGLRGELGFRDAHRDGRDGGFSPGWVADDDAKGEERRIDGVENGFGPLGERELSWRCRG